MSGLGWQREGNQRRRSGYWIKTEEISLAFAKVNQRVARFESCYQSFRRVELQDSSKVGSKVVHAIKLKIEREGRRWISDDPFTIAPG